MLEGGIILHLDDKYRFPMTKPERDAQDKGSKETVLNLSHFLPSIFVLSVGLTLAVLTFPFEYIAKKRVRRKHFVHKFT